jgi:Rrf2 family transcriptional regulator, nitric oxide-sensitive transcriptional repressor
VHLTLHADYSLRVLLFLAAHPERLVSTQEVSEAYGISKHHLVRVVQTLGRHGFIEVRPGRAGGILLARAPSEISLGEVFRVSEPDFNLVECFERDTNTCPIAPACGLKGVLYEAREAFLAVLGKYTVADVVKRSRKDLTDFFLPAAAAREP